MKSISHPEQLAFELYSQDMISKTVCGETLKITEHLIQSKLVAAVEDQIAVNPSVFHKFLSMLREDPSLVYIADAMSDSYRKYSSIARCIVAKPALTWNSTL